MVPRGRSADGEELGPALREQLVGAERRAAVELLDDRALERADRRVGVAVGAAERLGDDPVDHAQRLEVGRR